MIAQRGPGKQGKAGAAETAVYFLRVKQAHPYVVGRCSPCGWFAVTVDGSFAQFREFKCVCCAGVSVCNSMCAIRPQALSDFDEAFCLLDNGVGVAVGYSVSPQAARLDVAHPG